MVARCGGVAVRCSGAAVVVRCSGGGAVLCGGAAVVVRRCGCAVVRWCGKALIKKDKLNRMGTKKETPARKGASVNFST